MDSRYFVVFFVAARAVVRFMHRAIIVKIKKAFGGRLDSRSWLNCKQLRCFRSAYSKEVWNVQDEIKFKAR
jgi:hypothetical protein